MRASAKCHHMSGSFMNSRAGFSVRVKITGNVIKTAAFITCRLKMRLNKRIPGPTGFTEADSEGIGSGAADVESIALHYPRHLRVGKDNRGRMNTSCYCAAHNAAMSRFTSPFQAERTHRRERIPMGR